VGRPGPVEFTESGPGRSRQFAYYLSRASHPASNSGECLTRRSGGSAAGNRHRRDPVRPAFEGRGAFGSAEGLGVVHPGHVLQGFVIAMMQSPSRDRLADGLQRFRAGRKPAKACPLVPALSWCVAADHRSDVPSARRQVNVHRPESSPFRVRSFAGAAQWQHSRRVIRERPRRAAGNIPRIVQNLLLAREDVVFL
jgi:hypothetical protein